MPIENEALGLNAVTDDIVTRLLDFKPLDDADLARLMLDAANEIFRLRKVIVQFVDAEDEYLLAMNENDVVIIEQQWKDAWRALDKEAQYAQEIMVGDDNG